MHFEALKNRLIFLNKWKAFLAQQKEKDAKRFAVKAQWQILYNQTFN